MEKRIGKITHYYAEPNAAVLDLRDNLSVGDRVHILGETTDFTETVKSMQIDRKDVESAGPGEDVAILVKNRVRDGDEVFLMAGQG